MGLRIDFWPIKRDSKEFVKITTTSSLHDTPSLKEGVFFVTVVLFVRPFKLLKSAL